MPGLPQTGKPSRCVEPTWWVKRKNPSRCNGREPLLPSRQLRALLAGVRADGLTLQTLPRYLDPAVSAEALPVIPRLQDGQFSVLTMVRPAQGRQESRGPAPLEVEHGAFRHRQADADPTRERGNRSHSSRCRHDQFASGT